MKQTTNLWFLAPVKRLAHEHPIWMMPIRIGKQWLGVLRSRPSRRLVVDHDGAVAGLLEGLDHGLKSPAWGSGRERRSRRNEPEALRFKRMSRVLCHFTPLTHV